MSVDLMNVLKLERRKAEQLLGAQNEVANMAIKANAELEQINARLAGLSHHYEQLAKRAEDLKDEGQIQIQIAEDLEELINAECEPIALKYAEIVNSDGRYELVGVLNEKAWREHEHDWDRVEDIKAAVSKYLDMVIPF
jgi:trans-aconitate methyltransferase